MAYFVASCSSEESISSTLGSTAFSDDEVPQKKVKGSRATSKRTKKIPAKLKDYVLSVSKEEERLQKSMLMLLTMYI